MSWSENARPRKVRLENTRKRPNLHREIEFMSEKIVLPVGGGCPKCGNPEIQIPEEHTEETVVTCEKCGHKEPHLTFFKAGEE